MQTIVITYVTRHAFEGPGKAARRFGPQTQDNHAGRAGVMCVYLKMLPGHFCALPGDSASQAESVAKLCVLCDMGVSRNYGYLSWGSLKNSILESILGSPYFGKFPYLSPVRACHCWPLLATLTQWTAWR